MTTPKNVRAFSTGLFVVCGVIALCGERLLATCTQPSFRVSPNITTGDSPQASNSGDFNSDGKPDLVVANQAADTVSVFLGNGSGGFGAPVNLATGDAPNGTATGDFNRDGKLDIATVNFTADTLTILLGNGNGTFAGGITVATGDQPTSLVVGDFNSDGIPDIASVRLSRNNLTTHLGLGTGNFAAGVNVSIAPTLGARDIVAADLNRDGDLDLAASGGSGGASGLVVVLGNGAGVFGAPTFFNVTPSATDKLASGDFNQDGRVDIILGARSLQNAFVMIGNGTGGFFGPPPAISVSGGLLDVETADFNQDGRADLAFPKDSAAGGVAIFLGNGLGSFTLAPTVPSGSGFGLTVDDFNVDGKPDIAAVDTSNDVMSVRLNSCGGLTTKPVPDLTGDGAADIAFFRPSTGFWFVLRSEDSTFFSFPFGTSGDQPVAGDYDGDGTTDIAVFRPSTATWFIQNSGGTSNIVQFGIAGDKPTPTDYDRDGRTDIAIFRPSLGEWWMLRSNSNNSIFAAQFGAATDIPIQ